MSRVRDWVRTEISPVRVRNMGPSAAMESPVSNSDRTICCSGCRSDARMKSWTDPVPSRMSAKVTRPMPRRAISLPATATERRGTRPESSIALK